GLQPPLQGLEIDQDDRQQIVEIARHTAGKLADAFHFLGLHELFLRLLQRDLGFPALADVARDLGEADQPPLPVGDAIDHRAGPKARTILAHAPALGLELAAVAGYAQRPLGSARLAVFLGVEATVVLADDVLGGIALDALGPGVPIVDDATRIEHVDRVVGDAVHEQLETALGLLSLFGFGHQPGIRRRQFRRALADLSLEALFALAQGRLDLS